LKSGNDAPNVLLKIRAILITAPLIVLATIVMGSLSLVMSFFDSTGRRQHAIARAWSRILLVVSGVRVIAKGVEKLDPEKGYVLVANHSSYMDIPVIMATLPLQFRFFAKQGLFLIPFLGTHLKRAGHIPVVRGDARASLKSMSDGAKLIRERNVSVLLFPEGGRSADHLAEFKEGTAYIAIKAAVPAVPIGLEGMRKILKMHTAFVYPGTVHLRVGDLIDTSNLTNRDRETLTQELHARVAELCGESVPVH
jgi:1-acyl-sn-glycerol-3-phosphate acyltransferase